MLLFILAYLGGVLTIASPCILPVLPFVFARADQPFLRSGLPMLGGMAVTFAAVASLAAVGGGWVVAANDHGRLAALALMALFGVALLLPGLSDRLTRPLVALGARMSQSADPGYDAGQPSFVPSLVLGVAAGLLWAPCAGPVLGLILTGAALQGASVGTSLLLVAYAAGAATSLALALAVGGRVFAAMKRSLPLGEWVRGEPPGDSHGADVDAAGDGTVTEQRLYQLVRQNGTITDRTFEIRFLDPGVQAYTFTFG